MHTSVGLSMSEAVEGAGVTAGGLLKEARLASGMHIAALAVSLKVPVNKLEALEADNYEALPDTVFVRALASSVCRTLKLDPGPVLSLLPESKSPRLAANAAGLNAPVRGSIGKSSSSSASFSAGATSRSVTVVVLALLVGALALFFFPTQQDVPAVATEAPVSGKPLAVDAQQPAIPAIAGASSAVNDISRSPGAGLPESTPANAASQNATVALSNTASAPVVAASATTPPPGALVLRARSESWVQVRDAAGTVALQRNLAAGESVSVAGKMPLAVVIGRADATEVFVGGKPFDLTSVSRENVARFEVK